MNSGFSAGFAACGFCLASDWAPAVVTPAMAMESRPAVAPARVMFLGIEGPPGELSDRFAYGVS
jgi:hypothetical protein